MSRRTPRQAQEPRITVVRPPRVPGEWTSLLVLVAAMAAMVVSSVLLGLALLSVPGPSAVHLHAVGGIHE